LPYFNQAIAAHLDRPHLFVSLAKVEFDLNHFQDAYRDAAKAVAEAPRARMPGRFTRVPVLRWSASWMC